MAEVGQTQNHGEVEAENENRPLGNYVVLLIDVLGQKKKLVEWEKQARLCNGQLTPGLIKSLKNTAGVVTQIRRKGIGYFELANTDHVPEKLFASLPQEQKELWNRCAGGKIKAQCFSDTCVFYAPIGNGHGDINTRRVRAMIVGACWLMLDTLADKIPVRGSLCVRHGLAMGKEDFYGPALNCADYLEKKAEHPRILVDDSVTDLLTQCNRYSPDDSVDGSMKHYAKQALSLIGPEREDGPQIVDYAGEGWCEYTRGNHELFLPKIEAAYEFVCAEREKFRDHEKLGPRYALVEQYLTERLPLWRGDAADA
jgi:hypothetical protein